MKFHFSSGRTKMFRAALLIICVWTETLINVSLGCNDMPMLHVKVHGQLSLRCPNASEEEMTFRLLFNKQLIGSGTFNPNETKSQNITGVEVDLKVNQTNRVAHFVISSVSANGTGVYVCDAEILFPPPYRKLPTESTIVIVQEEWCQPQEITQCHPEHSPTTFWWPVGYGVLGIYCLAMTCLTAILWHKLKIKQCLQNDYMNMKPGGFRKHPRVQHPVIIGRY